MTRKDYVAIAKAIADARATHADPQGPEGIAVTLALFDLADKLGDVMQRDNKAFDRDRFLDACNL